MGGQRASKSQGAPLGTCGAVGGGREGGRRRWRRARRRGRSSTASSGEGLVAQRGGLASRGLSEVVQFFKIYNFHVVQIFARSKDFKIFSKIQMNSI